MKISLEVMEEAILPLVSKPNRYLGNIENIPRKTESNTSFRFLLAFPDTFEIGMSHLGLRILHHILSKRDDTLCELAFAPWPDMERALRENGLPLFSLEGRRPIHEFDVIGFSLQYELHFTNVLNMLDMGRIPLFSDQRTDSDPIVIAGGPCAFNPEPMSPFIDCFVIGDGEEAIMEIAESLVRAKKKGMGRREILRLLCGTEGVYVPSFYEPYSSPSGHTLRKPKEHGIPERVRSRFVRSLEGERYPERPLMPLTEIAHDRLTVEVMRGCTRGCRFCMAGYINRPLREKSSGDVLSEALNGIKCTGWSQVSLSSLSTSDYSRLHEVIPALRKGFLSKGVSLSLPSLRPGTLDRTILRELSYVRRPGLTFAPEAGTERLRRIINKPISTEDLVKTIEEAKEEGFRSVKLYFMIGLPGEREEDIDGIAEIAEACVKAGRRERGGMHIKLSISPFVPKPHTPFQWERMESVESLREKIRRLRRLLKSTPAELNWRSPEKSLIEASFSRGDLSLSNAILSAWKKGAKFDGWTDFFNFELWEDALRESGANLRMLTQGFDPNEKLPWEHIEPPVSKDFLLSEKMSSMEGTVTEDCRVIGCTNCGVKDCPMLGSPVTARDGKVVSQILREEGKLELGTVQSTADSDVSWTVREKGVFGRRPKREKKERETNDIFRVRFSKGERVRFLSHLDVMRRLDMALRRSGLMVSFGAGEVQRIELSFGHPLPLGMTSLGEYFDLSLARSTKREDVFGLNEFLPEGFRIEDVQRVEVRDESLMSSITHADYTLSFTDFLAAKLGLTSKRELGVMLGLAVRFIEETPELLIEGKNGFVNVRSAIVSINLSKVVEADASLFVRIELARIGGVRPERVLCAFFQEAFDWKLLRAERTGLWAERNGTLMSPMELVSGPVRRS